MSVVFTRIAIPVPGKRKEVISNFQVWVRALKSQYGIDAEIQERLGAYGEVALVARHDKLQSVEDTERKIIADSASGKLPIIPEGIVKEMRDSLWIVNE